MSALKNALSKETKPTREELVKNIQVILSSILAQLLAEPELAFVSVRLGERTAVFEIDLVQKDFGRLIGTRGKHIDALRTIVTAMAGSHGVRAVVLVKDQDRFF